MEKGWNRLPFRPISEFYQSRFLEKVYKIPVSVVDDCPNRRGLKGMKTCSFCDVWGSAARSETVSLTLEEQIEVVAKSLKETKKTKAFLVYFQAYTNSFEKISFLRDTFARASAFPEVRGFVVGTRPDCISPAVMNLWQEYHNEKFVSIELGVQSFFDDDLLFFRRGHSAQDNLKALTTLAKKTTLDLGIHLIFGSPFDTFDRIKETALICNSLPISNVKIHNLHVLKNTELEKLWNIGEFKPIELQEYADRVEHFLSYLSPRLFVHRLAAFSSRPDELIAPQWTSNKMKTHQYLVDVLRSRKTYQGKELESSFFERESSSLELSRALKSSVIYQNLD